MTFRHRSVLPGHPLISAVILLVGLFFTPACGKKGPPTLRAYEKPPEAVLVSAVHREDKILVRWDFPKGAESKISGFHLLKSADSVFEKAAEPTREARVYEDTDFRTATRYGYKIVARSLTGVLSEESKAVFVIPDEPPPPPEGLSIEVKDDLLVLSWERSGEGVLYNVYKSHEKGLYGPAPVNASPLSSNSFSDGFLLAKPVYYTVRGLTASEARDEGSPSREIAFDPAGLVPGAVEGLKFQAAPDRVFLYWMPAKERWVSGYRIYRDSGEGVYHLIGETQVPTFVDKEAPLTGRTYRVHAVGPLKEGPGTELTGVIYIPD